ncbi:MAG: hypothetical protein Q7O66_06450 [Dehalococcoidia bacterium]|nr:hypothetical protein [Dehalococcoidia bacterium]
MLHLNQKPVDLGSVREIIRHYCQGLTGLAMQIRSTEELAQWGIGWTSIEQATTEGSTIFLPPTIPDRGAPSSTFEAYKVLATHQAGHLEFGTFWFTFERRSTLFKDFRSILAEIAGAGSRPVTDFERFFDLFQNRRLAKDIFTIVEDSRVDGLLKQEYRGLRRPFRLAQETSLSTRPSLILLPLREAMLEILIMVSIDSCGSVRVPTLMVPSLRLVLGILRLVKHNEGATVEDSAEATIRLYCTLAGVPNTPSSEIPSDQWDTYDLSETITIDDDQQIDILRHFFACGEEAASEDSTSPYESPQDPDFRGELKPELAQTLMKLGLDDEEEEDGDPGGEIALEDLKRLFEKSAEIAADDREQLLPASFARNMLKEGKKAHPFGKIVRREQPNPRAKGQWQSRSPGSIEDFYYDEWDFLANQYKSGWCHLKQSVMGEGSGDFFTETLQLYAGLVTAVKKEFVQLKSEDLRKVKRLRDGDDLDFDSVVDSVVQKRVGAPYSDRVYWRRQKIERDVCVAFLLDMSASTFERLGAGDLSPDGAPAYPGLAGGKRIIDLEKEAVIVLIEALESIGDPYGIYGFSGHSRHNVEFAIIKDIAEELSPAVKRRVASICPVRGTRMGPAIRHVASILDRQEAKSKLIILISDGRPQDYDYGEHHTFEDWGAYQHLTKKRSLMDGGIPEEMRREYAIYDTRMALLEARQMGIKPFCLTIDKADHDYLRVMCGDLGYEILDNIYALPHRLPNLYRRLTTHP